MNSSLISDLLEKGNAIFDENMAIVPRQTLMTLEREITLLWIALGVVGLLAAIAWFTHTETHLWKKITQLWRKQ